MKIKYDFVLFCFLLFMIGFGFGHASAQLPSDLITKQPAPAAIDLSNVAPASAKAIDGLNPEIGPREDWQIGNFGRYNSYDIQEVQNATDGIDPTLQKFAGGEVAALPHVGNATNFTVINDTMVWF